MWLAYWLIPGRRPRRRWKSADACRAPRKSTCPGNAPGLGAHLFEALHAATPIVGAAKTGYRNDTCSELVYRGESRKPLYVTAAGAETARAAALIAACMGASHSDFAETGWPACSHGCGSRLIVAPRTRSSSELSRITRSSTTSAHFIHLAFWKSTFENIASLPDRLGPCRGTCCGRPAAWRSDLVSQEEQEHDNGDWAKDAD